MNKRDSLLALSMMLSMSTMLGSGDTKPKPKPLTFNERKKCFRQGCNNHRTGSSLYCSNECQELYHKELQEKEKSKLRI